ncbi:CHASE2 domain-containing protein [Roseobacter sp. S98]|uniref:CHASE2 domain-containing protein n=1 Tax=Roseobacter algicola (ex Choi et al. 2025) (nom. illeg.) TaxID=3092138 RepID=UPI003F51524B
MPHVTGRAGITETPELWLADLRFRLAGQQAPASEVVLVALDDETLDLPGGNSRRVLSTLIRNISDSGAAALAVDVLLADLRDPATDADLAAALASVPSAIAAAARFDRASGGALVPDALFAAAAQPGLVNVSTDTRGTPRYMPLVLDTGDGIYPAMALSAAVLFSGDQASFSDGVLTLGERTLVLKDGVYLPLRHLGPAGTVPTVSATALLDGPLSGVLQDRMVVLGYTASGVGDRFPTPFDDSTPGVEIIATAVSQLIGGPGLQRPENLRRWDAAHAVGLTILCLLALMQLPLSRSLPLIVLLMAASFGIAAMFFSSGVWISLAVPLLAAAPPVLFVAGFRYRLERQNARHTEMAATALRQFQAPALAERIARNPDFLAKPVDRFMSILFVDLSGFTSLSQRLGPDGTRDLLRSFHELTGEAVGRMGGSVLNYMGDGALAVFGMEPEKTGPQTDKALRAAFEIVQKLQAAPLPSGQTAPVRCRIGLHCGPVVLSRLGASSHQQVTVSGDNVNLASRLMETAKEEDAVVVASDDFMGALNGPPPFSPEKRTGVRVRGRSGDISVCIWKTDTIPDAG